MRPNLIPILCLLSLSQFAHASDDFSFNDFLFGLSKTFVESHTMGDSQPVAKLNRANPAATAQIIQSTNQAISRSAFSGKSTQKAFGLNASVNCAYQALLSPISTSTLMGEDALTALRDQCSINVQRSQFSTLTEVSHTMSHLRKAYQYKLIIEKCSRDNPAAPICKTADKDGSKAAAAAQDGCDSSVTKQQSALDQNLTPCPPELFQNKWREIRNFITDSAGYHCSKSSQHAPQDCDEDASFCVCTIEYDTDNVPEMPTKAGFCSKLVTAYGPMLDSLNSIIKDQRTYLGSKLAILVASDSSQSLPGLLTYDNLGTTNTCNNTDAPSVKKQGNVDSIATMLRAAAGIASSSSKAKINTGFPLPQDIILAGKTGMSFVALDESKSGKVLGIRDNKKKTIKDIISFRRDTYKKIEDTRNSKSKKTSGSNIMRASAMSNIAWMLNQRLTNVATNHGQQCTPQELQHYTVTRRYTQDWITKVKQANPADLLREIAFELADIHKQAFYNHQVLERILMTESMGQLYQANQMSTSYAPPIGGDDDMISYIKGSDCKKPAPKKDDDDDKDSSSDQDASTYTGSGDTEPESKSKGVVSN